MDSQDSTSKPARQYRMKARAQSAAMTGERILDAAVEIFYEHPMESISLDEVARRSGFTVQTIIRRFGSKDGLFAAAAERETKRVANQREQVTAGDMEGALDVLLDHYEEVGEGVLRMLSEETRSPTLQAIVSQGRKYHKEWCEKVFAPALNRLEGEERERRLAQFIALTDIYTWKILCQDRGLSRSQTKLAIKEMLLYLMGGG